MKKSSYLAWMATLIICCPPMLVADTAALDAYTTAFVREHSLLSFVGHQQIKDSDGRILYNDFSYHLRTPAGFEYRLNEGRDPHTNRRYAFAMVTNEDGTWYISSRSVLKAAPDYVALDFFNIKRFNSITTTAEQFRFLPQLADDKKGLMVIERSLPSGAQRILRAQIDEVRTVVSHALSSHPPLIPGITNKRDIVPVRAIFKLDPKSGLLLEDAYYNSAGEYLGFTRQYDYINTHEAVTRDRFTIPVGLDLVTPKNAEETIKALLSL